ncbi:rho GTPase-activating protein 30 [Dendropsophus ebraccatus]|uniref:rho GTPase-activating protein 30 n=1 Tax=Dendropsophus ebraccatus TaxID=150705 RepID=UPI0038312A04
MSLAMKARQRVKKKTVKDKIFGCDLLEHLQMSGQEVPQVLRSCTEFVEEHGIVDGIYRLCGIASNVQKLRQEFDIDRPPDLNKSTYLQDVHCVSSLCKAYFRELPNPLLTYQLYDKFADAVAIQLEEQRLIKIREVLQELPIPHYRTLEYLMRHLLRMASHSARTNMHARNLAIVWAPNLLRSKDIESSGFNGTAAFMEVRVQSIVVEFILTHVEQVFGDGSSNGKENEGSPSVSSKWPMAACVPEDYYRSLSYNLPNMLNHGDGPPQIRPYHTIIEFTDQKRKGSLKAKKWKSIFNLGRSNPDSKRKSQKQDDKDGKPERMSLRPAKSMDSLSSVPQATLASDLEQNNLVLRSPRNQLSLRRESLGSPSKEENVEFTFLDCEEQPHSLDTNDTEYEDEDGQAKSEPTTPKSGRSSISGIPLGRSPKSNPSRAEKCVGVHISEPYSVTLPFHITSNLSRLTRGMECPRLSTVAPHKGSKTFFSLDGNLCAEPEDTDKTRLSQVADQESDKWSGAENTETEEPEKQNARLSLEVQDSFSFLDAQDTSTEKIPENIVDNEMLGYDPHAMNQMEEFSVEPPPDDLCEVDEAEQAYFMPMGFVDEIGHWKVKQESLEDIYLSAHDDLSPITQDPEIALERLQPSSEVQHCMLHENFIKGMELGEGALEEDQLKPCDVSYSQEQSLVASETQRNKKDNIVVDGHDSQGCSPDDAATKEHVPCSRELDTSEEETTRLDSGFREDNNMDIPNLQDKTAHSAPEEIQQEGLNREDHMVTVNGKELEQSTVPTGQEGAENDMNYTVEQLHECENLLEEHMTPHEPTSWLTEIHLLSKAPPDYGDGKNEDLTVKNPDLHDGENISDNCLSRIENISTTNPSPGPEEMVNQQSHSTDGGSAEGPESTTDTSIGDCSPEAVEFDEICDHINTTTLEEKLKDSLQEEGPAKPANEEDVKGQRLPHICCPPAEVDSNLPNGMYPDGSVAMKLMATTNKIQQIKSVPVVPPKPQFAKLPPALKSKIQIGTSSSLNRDGRSQKSEKSSHTETAETSTDTVLKSKIQVSSLSSENRDRKSQKPEKSSDMETTETSTDNALKRRSSWRNATSISFDTAMSLAKERQSQNPIRRMQTYCVGDSYDIMDTSKTDNAPHAPRFTVKSASSRTHRPFSCMPLSCSEGELLGSNTLEEKTLHGLQSIFTHEPDAYSKEVPHRNRLSMPRLGQLSVGEDKSKCHQQRRSLL